MAWQFCEFSRDLFGMVSENGDPFNGLCVGRFGWVGQGVGRSRVVKCRSWPSWSGPDV